MASQRERILEIAGKLPAAPRVFAELERLLRDPNSGLEPVVALVKRDATLVGQIIRVSNSAAYAGEQRTGSVEEAVVRLGFQEVFRIVGHLAGSQLADRKLEAYGIEPDALREHMLYTAFMAEHLAAECGLDPRLAYTAGIMRPLGLLVLDRLAEHYGTIATFGPAGTDFLAWEGQVFGLASSEVAALVLHDWSFPPEIVDAVRAHHLNQSRDHAQPLAAVLNLACSVAEDNGRGFAGEARHWMDLPARLVGLGLPQNRFNAAVARAQAALTTFKETGVMQPVESQVRPKKTPEKRNSAAAPRVLETNDEPPVQLSTASPAPLADFPTEAVAPAVSTATDDFTTLMRNYQDMVFSTAARITGNDAQAEDIAQEVFLKAYENFDSLRGTPTAGGWLKTVATNLSLNHVSRYRNRWRFFSEFRRTDDDGGETDEAPVDFADPQNFFGGLDAADRRELVERALAQLPEHQRVPLVLYHFEDMPYEDIAKRLRISLAKVKTDILRARAALAKILARCGTAHEANPLSS